MRNCFVTIWLAISGIMAVETIVTMLGAIEARSSWDTRLWIGAMLPSIVATAAALLLAAVKSDTVAEISDKTD